MVLSMKSLSQSLIQLGTTPICSLALQLEVRQAQSILADSLAIMYLSESSTDNGGGGGNAGAAAGGAIVAIVVVVVIIVIVIVAILWIRRRYSIHTCHCVV